jgi:hypothetical protein
MYILNIDDVPGMKTFRCGKSLGNWLQKEKHIPLLAMSKDGKKMVFADTDLLQEVLKQKPFFFEVLEIFD